MMATLNESRLARHWPRPWVIEGEDALALRSASVMAFAPQDSVAFNYVSLVPR